MATKKILAFKQGIEDGISAAKGILEDATRHSRTLDSLLSMMDGGQVGIPFHVLIDLMVTALSSAFPKPQKIRRFYIRDNGSTFTLVVVYNNRHYPDEEDVFTTTDEGEAHLAAKVLLAWKHHGGS